MGEFMDKVKGKVKELEGKLTGDKKKQAEGIADQVKGKAEEIKQAARETLDEDKKHLD
jgi:uncharacterized protein YjbJ (UPF0337 family)